MSGAGPSSVVVADGASSFSVPLASVLEPLPSVKKACKQDYVNVIRVTLNRAFSNISWKDQVMAVIDLLVPYSHIGQFSYNELFGANGRLKVKGWTFPPIKNSGMNLGLKVDELIAIWKKLPTMTMGKQIDEHVSDGCLVYPRPPPNPEEEELDRLLSPDAFSR